MTLLIPAKVLLHVWSYGFYDMTLSTGKQRRHMIKCTPERIALGKSRFWPDLRHSSITMCTRTHDTWKVKILAQPQALIYYNVYQNVTTIGKSRFRKYIRHSSITICTRTHYPRQVRVLAIPRRHSIITLCIRTHYTWQINVLARPQAFISYHVC